MKAYEFSDAKLGIVFENAEIVRPSLPALKRMLTWSNQSDGSNVAVVAFQLPVPELFVHGCGMGRS